MAQVLGILGGMGPLATADFFRKLAQNTPARADQDHIPTVIYSASHIPDRTSSIMGEGPSPECAMKEGVFLLEKAGARLIAIPCNTAHFWHAKLAEIATVPILHIAECVCADLQTRLMPGAAVGLLATNGTVAGRIYQPFLETAEFQIRLPSPDEQTELVMQAIKLVKEGRTAQASDLLAVAARRLFDRGASAIIMGCTEIPIALEASPFSDRLVDATAILAKACVTRWHQTSPDAISRMAEDDTPPAADMSQIH